jgi:hypothetical protein
MESGAGGQRRRHRPGAGVHWLQALEGEIDSAHAPILRGRIDAKGAISDWIAARDLKPMFQSARQDFRVSITDRRRLDNGMLFWRVNQFVMPFYSLVPPQSKFPDLSGHVSVPMDDEHTLCLMFSYHPTKACRSGLARCFWMGTMAARADTRAATRICQKGLPRQMATSGPSTARSRVFCLTMKSEEVVVFRSARSVGAGRGVPMRAYADL